MKKSLVELAINFMALPKPETQILGIRSITSELVLNYMNINMEFLKPFFPITDLQRVPDSVIDSMASKLEIPMPQKNHWEKFSFRIVLSENIKESIELCLNMIFMAANNPVEALEDNTKAREIARAQCNASVIHQADKLLRYSDGSVFKN